MGVCQVSGEIPHLPANVGHGDDFPGLSLGHRPDREKTALRIACGIANTPGLVDVEPEAMDVGARPPGLEQIPDERVRRSGQIAVGACAVDQPVGRKRLDAVTGAQCAERRKTLSKRRAT